MFDYPVGSIIELIGHDTPHCGVVMDNTSSVELIACKDKERQKMLCKLILVRPMNIQQHPVTAKEPLYKLRQKPLFPWTTQQLKERVKLLKPKYDESEYHVIYNNCQHFAWELSTGTKASPDAEKFALVGGLIGWAMNLKDFGILGASTSSGSFSVESLQRQLDDYCSRV